MSKRTVKLFPKFFDVMTTINIKLFVFFVMFNIIDYVLRNLKHYFNI